MEEQCKHEEVEEIDIFRALEFDNGYEVERDRPKYVSEMPFINTVCTKCGKTVKSVVNEYCTNLTFVSKEWKVNKKSWLGLEFDHTNYPCKHTDTIVFEEIERAIFDKNGNNDPDPFIDPSNDALKKEYQEAVFEITRCKSCGAILRKKFKKLQTSIFAGADSLNIDTHGYWNKREFELDPKEKVFAIPLDPLVLKYPDLFYQKIIREGGVYGGGIQLNFDRDDYAVSTFFVGVFPKKGLDKPVKQYPITLPGIEALRKAYTFDNSEEFLKERL